MRILIDYLLWLAFTAFYFVCGLAYFPQTDHRLLVGLSILLGWLTAMALVLFWKLKNSPIRKPAPAEDVDSNDKTKYPGGPANHFVGLIADGGAISGATITTSTMTNGVNAGLYCFKYLAGGKADE